MYMEKQLEMVRFLQPPFSLGPFGVFSVERGDAPGAHHRHVATGIEAQA